MSDEPEWEEVDDAREALILRQVRRAAAKDPLFAARGLRLDNARILEATGGRCGICGGEIERPSRWQIDHILPLALGGDHTY
jgi:hypothetical protein